MKLVIYVMHIKLKNNKFLFGKYKVKCALGKRGIIKKKLEGDNATPRGSFDIKNLYYRKDRIRHIKTKLKKIIIKKNMGWCDDPGSQDYNKLITFPFKYGAEKLYIKKNIYDLIIVLNYNMRPTIKKKGSAIFLHLSTKNYTPTKGCVAISKKNMIQLLKKMNKKNKITIF